MTRIFEDRLVTIRFVLPGLIDQDDAATEAAFFKAYTQQVKIALAPLHPFMIGLTITNEKSPENE